jgi:proline-specific peptidase
MAPPSVVEGRIPFHGYETWYRIEGEGEEPGKLPLLCLHGGPGATWHHMESYASLAEGRGVIFYDQLGCGNSAIAAPHDPAMWTTELYVEEVDVVREALGLERVHILGQSWGGMLAMAYAITQPAGVASLAIQSSPPSVPFWLTELDVLRAALPPDVEATLRRHEAAGTMDSAEYQETMLVFYDRHVCRVPWPDWLQRAFEAIEANPEVYHTVNGPSEFHVIGPLKDFDVTGGLGRIQAPALIFCGRHDEVTPKTAELAHEGIPGSEFVVIEDASHMAQAEQPDQVFALMRDWLARNEAGA